MDLARQVLAKAKELAEIPIRTATSKSAQRAYVGTALFGLFACTLLGVSTISFLIFYNVYIPKIGIQRPLYLQFGQGHPFARTDLANGLTSNQPYDISISLVLPRTPSNIAAGNFMLDVALLPSNASQTEKFPIIQQLFDVSEPAIARSRRPAILTYASPVVDLAQTLGGLPLYTLGWRKERETIEVSMFEGVEFRRGSANIPDRVQVMVEADEKMQFYSASIKVHAKFQGLRWILYNYKITSFVIFTATFFVVSVISTLLIYLVFTFNTSPGGKSTNTKIKKETKTESIAESDHSRTGQQTPASIAPAGSDNVEIKKEDFDSLEPSDIPPLGGEADDEDEDEAYDGNTSAWRDSGIGTGREDTRDAGGRRRKSYMK